MKKITAVLTLYYPDNSVINNISALAKQVDRILLADNSLENNELMFLGIEKVKYFWNQCNLGLSSAFNRIFYRNEFDDEEFIIFFDQDSTIPDEYINKLCNYFENIEKTIKIGCIGPQYIDTNTKKLITPRFIREVYDGCYIVSSMITSGLLTKYKILKDISFWNEQIFLDMADWDFCWRLKEKKYQIVICTKITLIHTLGKGIKKIGFLKIRQNHPVREYYQLRDCRKLFVKSYVPLKYKIRFLIMLYIMPIFYVIFLPNRVQRLIYIKHAFLDSLKRKNGSFESIHGSIK